MKRNAYIGKQKNIGFSFRALSDDDLEELHLATLEILEHQGIFIEDEEALDILDGGAPELTKNRK